MTRRQIERIREQLEALTDQVDEATGYCDESDEYREEASEAAPMDKADIKEMRDEVEEYLEQCVVEINAIVQKMTDIYA